MQNLELMYLAIPYIMAGLLFRFNREGKHLTASEIAASRRLTHHIFFWGLSSSSVVLALLMFGWFIPHFALGPLFGALIVMVIVFKVLTGLVPAKGRKRTMAHLFFAFGLGFWMIAVAISLAFTSTVRPFIRVADGLLALFMIGLVVSGLIVVKKRGVSTSHIRRQNLFFGSWHAVLFLTVYLG
jgi:hypothetical protein